MARNEPPIVAKAFRLALDAANGRSALSKLIPPALLALDAVFCALVLWKIPYTEIDWVAYMQQVSQFVGGERDYTRIAGGTGPLVYPGAHVLIYTALYHVTDEGENVWLAQRLFAMLYLATLAVVMACYWQAKVPPYVFPLLILSKRLHSIFMLRCFNDCFAVFFLWLAIFLFQRRQWTLGGLAYSLGLGVKMSLLLVLPAVSVVLFLGRGFRGALRVVLLMAQVQVAIGLPFLSHNPWGYLGRAFELSRQFLFRWTVNWRFVGEDVFLSRPFAAALLVLHASVLVAFITTRWLKPSQKSLADILTPMLSLGSPFSAQEESVVSLSVTGRYVMATVLAANVAGMLFARSLHYQFYSYLAWSTPFLLWRGGVHPVLQYGLWALQEWAWNVYPSTPISSAVVVGVLAVTALVTWAGATEEYEPRRAAAAEAGPAKR